MRTVFLLLFALNTLLTYAQTVDFESFNTGSTNSLDGSDGKGGFEIGPLFLPNSYNAQWQSWSGWAISSTIDTITKGYTNQFGNIAGKGSNASAKFAVAYAPSTNVIAIKDPKVQISSIAITNNTYAYFSMKEGDAFAKKFGGINGNDNDFFKVSIGKFNKGVKSAVLKEVFLADFRNADNSKDFILKSWTTVDLTNVGQADSLYFELSSSDNGAFGMNTPAYFCIDNITYKAITRTDAEELDEVYAYPTLVNDAVVFNGEGQWQVINMLGKTMCATEGNTSFNAQELATGNYFAKNEKGQIIRFIKY